MKNGSNKLRFQKRKILPRSKKRKNKKNKENQKRWKKNNNLKLKKLKRKNILPLNTIVIPLTSSPVKISKPSSQLNQLWLIKTDSFSKLMRRRMNLSQLSIHGKKNSMEAIESMPKLKKFQELFRSYKLRTNGSIMMAKIQAEEFILIASMQSKAK